MRNIFLAHYQIVNFLNISTIKSFKLLFAIAFKRRKERQIAIGIVGTIGGAIQKTTPESIKTLQEWSKEIKSDKAIAKFGKR